MSGEIIRGHVISYNFDIDSEDDLLYAEQCANLSDLNGVVEVIIKLSFNLDDDCNIFLLWIEHEKFLSIIFL